MKAECIALFRRHLLPISARGFQKRVGADNIGFDKRRCTVNRAVDMAFRRQMHQCIGLVRGKHALKLGAVADIHLLEGIARAGGHRFERLEIAGISELVYIDHAVVGVPDDMAHKRRADKAGTAGDEDFQDMPLLRCWSFCLWVCIDFIGKPGVFNLMKYYRFLGRVAYIFLAFIL